MPPLSKLDHALAAREASGSADFHIHTSAMELGSWHGSPVVSMIGSSNVRDLRGDTIMDSALKDMAMVEKGMVIWLNHDYSLPNSLFGSLVESPRVEYTNGIADLRLVSDVETTNDAAARTLKYIEKGRKLGCSVGMRVDEARIDEDFYAKSGNIALLIDRVTPVEWSVVGVPCNQRSWVENATKGYFAKSLHALSTGDTPDLRLASVVRALFPKEYREMVKSVEDEALRALLTETAPASKPAKRIIFDTSTGAWKLNTKSGTEDVSREKVEALLADVLAEIERMNREGAPADAPASPVAAGTETTPDVATQTDDQDDDTQDDTDDDDDDDLDTLVADLLIPLDVDAHADPDVEGERNSHIPLVGDITLDPLPSPDESTLLLTQNAASKGAKRKPRKPMKPTKERPQYNYKGVVSPKIVPVYTKDATGAKTPTGVTVKLTPVVLHATTAEGEDSIGTDESLAREAAHKAAVAVLTAEQRAQYEAALAETPLTDEVLAKAFRREQRLAKKTADKTARQARLAAAREAIVAGADGHPDKKRVKQLELLEAVAANIGITVNTKKRTLTAPDPSTMQWRAARVLVKQASRVLRKAGRSVSEENMTQLQLAHDALATVTDGIVCKGSVDSTDMRSADATPGVTRAHYVTQYADLVAMFNGMVKSLQSLDLGETKTTLMDQAAKVQHEMEVSLKRIAEVEKKISDISSVNMGRPTSFVGRSVDLDPAAATWMEMATSGAKDASVAVKAQDHGPTGTRLTTATRKGYQMTMRHWPAGVTGDGPERPSLEPEQMGMMSVKEILAYNANEDVTVPEVRA